MSESERPTPRTARAVINEALKENRFWEWTCFALIAGFAVFGCAAMAVGLGMGEWKVVASGAGTNAVVWLCLRCAMHIRTQNMAIRLAEVALNKAKDASEAADILSEAIGRKGKA